MIALTEALALELARDRMLVNAIAPGPIVPPPDMTQAEIDEVAKATPVGRWGGEIEIAKRRRDAVRDRLHHRRDHPRRRRPPSGMTRSGFGRGEARCRVGAARDR